mgnify:CR=1 FL=1
MDLLNKIHSTHEMHQELNLYREALAASSSFVFTWELATDIITLFSLSDDLSDVINSKSQQTGSSWLSRIHKDDVEHLLQKNSQLIHGDIDVIDIKFRLANKSGEWVWFNAQSRIQTRQANGRINSIICIGNIISASKEQLQALEQKNHRVANAFKGTLDTIWDWNLIDDRVGISKNWQALFELSSANNLLTSADWAELIHPDDLKHTNDAIISILRNKTSYMSIEYRIHLKGGAYHWVLVRGHVSGRLENGRVSHITGALISIDKLKKQEEIFKKQQQTINLAMLSTGSALIEFDFQQQTYTLSTYTLNAGEISLTTQELLLADAIQNIHPNDHSEFRRYLERIRCNNSAEINDTKWRSKLQTSEYRWYQLRAHVTETDCNSSALKAIGIRQDIHSSYEAEYQYHVNHEREVIAYKNSLHSVWEFHPQTGYVFFSKYLIEKLSPIGINRPWDNSFDYCIHCIHPDDIDKVKTLLAEQATNSKQIIDITYRFHTPSGDWIWVRAEGKVTERNEQYQPTKLIGTLIDITDLKRTENELEKEKELAQTTLKSINEAVITTDDKGLITTLNHTAEKLLSVTQKTAIGASLNSICTLSEETSISTDYNPVQLCLQSDLAFNLTKLQLINLAQQTFYIECSVSPLHAKHKEVIGSVLVIRDVSESRKTTHEIEHRAQHDALTGIFNRHAFEASLEENTQVDEYNHSLCYIDLDQFKIVNDTCGHIAGDELLRQLSKKLSGIIRQSDIFARLGGDEFGILMLNCQTDRAVKIANNIKKTVSDYTFHWEDKTFRLGASIGIAAINPNISTTLALQHADTACFAAKDQGRNRIHVFSFDDTEMALTQGHMSWVPKLHAALNEDHFELYAQAITSLQRTSAEGVHIEILIRLNENGKIIPPGAFLAAAERYNLSTQIDRWVIENTLLKLNTYQEHIKPNDVFNINLSAASLSDHSFLSFIKKSFANNAVSPSQICFEITETAAVTNLTAAHALIIELKKMGCEFALDDFGSGLSSFGYLKNFPVDYLKIDGAFVKDLIDDPIDAAMVKSINEIGQIMGKKTVAEFVENQAIADALREMGVDYAQGYYFSVPKPLIDFLNKEPLPEKPVHN